MRNAERGNRCFGGTVFGSKVGKREGRGAGEHWAAGGEGTKGPKGEGTKALHAFARPWCVYGVTSGRG